MIIFPLQISAKGSFSSQPGHHKTLDNQSCASFEQNLKSLLTKEYKDNKPSSSLKISFRRKSGIEWINFKAFNEVWVTMRILNFNLILEASETDCYRS